jgi:uroporphyrin-III C-methyltransferase
MDIGRLFGFCKRPLQKVKAPYVYICGAGPGDPELLTLKTYNLLQRVADVVVYDRLIPEALMDKVPAHVERIYAGKACKQHHMTQDEINALLVEQASKGKIVVRLKGGDPFIFGRGGEEMLHLIKHEIPFEIVPGVNAADGCAAYCGIPLTHRELASSVLFLTGHQQKGAAIHLDYAALVAPDRTLVIYMGLTHLDEITRGLIAHGLAPSTPVVAIYQGTTPEEKKCFSTVGTIYEETKAQDFSSPTIIIIGKVVTLGQKAH